MGKKKSDKLDAQMQAAFERLNIVRIDEDGAEMIKFSDLPGAENAGKLLKELSAQFIRDEPGHQHYMAGVVDVAGEFTLEASTPFLIMPKKKIMAKALVATWGGQMDILGDTMAWFLTPFEQYRLLAHIGQYAKMRYKDTLAYVKCLQELLIEQGVLDEDGVPTNILDNSPADPDAYPADA